MISLNVAVFLKHFWRFFRSPITYTSQIWGKRCCDLDTTIDEDCWSRIVHCDLRFCRSTIFLGEVAVFFGNFGFWEYSGRMSTNSSGGWYRFFIATKLGAEVQRQSFLSRLGLITIFWGLLRLAKQRHREWGRAQDWTSVRGSSGISNRGTSPTIAQIYRYVPTLDVGCLFSFTFHKRLVLVPNSASSKETLCTSRAWLLIFKFHDFLIPTNLPCIYICIICYMLYIYMYIGMISTWPLQEDPCSIISDWYYFGGLGRCDTFGQVSHHVSALVKS